MLSQVCTRAAAPWRLSLPACRLLALLIAVTAPYFLGANWVYQTVTFDEFTWMVAFYCFLSLVLEHRPRYWIYLGLSLGIGLQVKYTIVGLAAAIGIAVLLTPALRSDLRTRYPWIAAGIALLICAPNLAWQVAKGFPSLIYIANHQGSGGGFVANLVLIVVYLFFLIPLWVAGLVSLLRSASLAAPSGSHAFFLSSFSCSWASPTTRWAPCRSPASSGRGCAPVSRSQSRWLARSNCSRLLS